MASVTNKPPLFGGPSDSDSEPARLHLASPPGSRTSACLSESSISKSPPEASVPLIVHFPANGDRSPRLAKARQTRSLFN